MVGTKEGRMILMGKRPLSALHWSSLDKHMSSERSEPDATFQKLFGDGSAPFLLSACDPLGTSALHYFAAYKALGLVAAFVKQCKDNLIWAGLGTTRQVGS